jgi:hypothetical protein
MEITGGLKEGDHVVMLGAIMTSRPAVPPKLQIAAEMRRGAPVTRAVEAATTTTQAGKPAQTGTPAPARKPLKP